MNKVKILAATFSNQLGKAGIILKIFTDSEERLLHPIWVRLVLNLHTVRHRVRVVLVRLRVP